MGGELGIVSPRAFIHGERYIQYDDLHLASVGASLFEVPEPIWGAAARNFDKFHIFSEPWTSLLIENFQGPSSPPDDDTFGIMSVGLGKIPSSAPIVFAF